MGTINSKTKDAATAGDFSARLQWLRDEMTEYFDSVRELNSALKQHAWGSEAVARAHIDASMEAYDIFGLLIRFESRRLIEYFCFTIKTKVVEHTLSMPEHDYLIGCLEDWRLSQDGYTSWHAKQVARGRQPIAISSFQRLREVLSKDFGMRRALDLSSMMDVQTLIKVLEELGKRGGTNE